jgi:hypothetical protein
MDISWEDFKVEACKQLENDRAFILQAQAGRVTVSVLNCRASGAKIGRQGDS